MDGADPDEALEEIDRLLNDPTVPLGWRERLGLRLERWQLRREIRRSAPE